MKKAVFTILSSALFLSSIATAQSLGEKSGVNSTLGITPKTQDFVTEAASGDMFEIASSMLAQQKADGAQVKQFAGQMITDHTRTSSDLKGLAQDAHLSLPPQMASSQQSMMDKLRGLSGADFTKQYMDDQVSAHKGAVSLFQRYGQGGDDEKLKSWATMMLPTLQHHLDMAQTLDK
jgi:putative membrane protein